MTAKVLKKFSVVLVLACLGTTVPFGCGGGAEEPAPQAVPPPEGMTRIDPKGANIPVGTKLCLPNGTDWGTVLAFEPSHKFPIEEQAGVQIQYTDGRPTAWVRLDQARSELFIKK